MLSTSAPSKLLRTNFLLSASRRAVVSSNGSQRSKLLPTSQCDADDGGGRRFRHKIGLTGLAGLAGLAGLTGQKILAEEEKKEEGEDIFKKAGARIEGLPDFRLSEVHKHDSETKRVWVTFREGVYDITDFIPNHPGAKNILMAAGGSVEPFWNLYAVHKNNADVYNLIEQFRIGNLHPDDVDPVSGSQGADDHDPWANEPQRHPALIAANKTPFNGETPLSLLADNAITPNELFYVRNHLPVPKLDEKTFRLEIEGFGGEGHHVEVSMDDIKNKVPKTSVVAAIQCGGNRRADMNSAKPVLGLAWQGGAIGNAEWAGARLVDVLAFAGVDVADPKIKHVQFEGADHGADGLPYGASIPVEKAFNPWGDVILAYEMNGQPIPRDHGFPLRVIVPGVVGARNVKWVQRIVLSDHESQSHWQQNDYKILNPSVTENPNFADVRAIQNMPVTSVVCQPDKNSTVKLDRDGKMEVRGYAFSGGGNKIWRVDLSIDQGKTWIEAKLETPPGLPEPPRHWSWTIWTAKISVPEGTKQVEVWSKASDCNNNVQPTSYDGTWNLRGLLANAYSKVRVDVKP